jgi:gluconate kinase
VIVSKFTKGLGLTDADIKAFLYTYSNKQKQQLNKANMKRLAIYETLKEKERDFVSPNFSA